MKKIKILFTVALIFLVLFLGYKYRQYRECKADTPLLSEFLQIDRFMGRYVSVSMEYPPSDVLEEYLHRLDSVKFKKEKYTYLRDSSGKYSILLLRHPSHRPVNCKKILQTKVNSEIPPCSFMDVLLGKIPPVVMNNSVLYEYGSIEIKYISTLKEILRSGVIIKHSGGTVMPGIVDKKFFMLLDSLGIQQGGILFSYVFNHYIQKGKDISHIDYSFLNVYIYKKGKLNPLFPYHYRLSEEKERILEKSIQKHFPTYQYVRFSVVPPDYQKYLISQ